MTVPPGSSTGRPSPAWSTAAGPRRGIRPRTVLTPALVGIVVLVALGFGGLRLLRSAAGPDELRASADVTLTPDGDGTRVTVLLLVSGSGSFPDPARVTLPAQDDGVSTDGTGFTGGTLQYTDLVDGAGAPVTPDGGRNPVVRPTGGGPRLQLGYRVAALDGRRVLLPVPGVAGIRVEALTVHGSGPLDPAGLRCWQGGGSDNGQLSYHPCTLDGTGTLQLTGGSQIRLEPPA